MDNQSDSIIYGIRVSVYVSEKKLALNLTLSIRKSHLAVKLCCKLFGRKPPLDIIRPVYTNCKMIASFKGATGVWYKTLSLRGVTRI